MWYPLTLLAFFYISFVGLIALIYTEVTSVRSAHKKSEQDVDVPAFWHRAEHIIVACVTWFKSFCAVSVFKFSAVLHGLTARLMSRLYRKAAPVRDTARVSALLRSLKRSNKRVVR